MAESNVAVTEGTPGKRLHTFNRSIGGISVEDEVVLQGEPYLATYRIFSGTTSIATLDSHLVQIMAGATLNVYVRRIRVYQFAVATTVAIGFTDMVRLTTAGTGGTSSTFSPLDATDVASGATFMTLPTVKGTEGASFDRQVAFILQTLPATPTYPSPLLYDFQFETTRSKGLRIPAGTANGIAIKNRVASAAAAVISVAELVEANF